MGENMPQLLTGKIGNNISFMVPDGIIVIDKGKKIIAFNESAQRITGLEEDDVLSKDLSFLFPNPDNDQKYILNSIKNKITYSNLRMEIISSNNIPINVIVSITPLEHPPLGTIGVIVVFRNIEEMISIFDELQERNKELLNEKNKIEAIFNSRSEGTFTIDMNWKITSFNRAAERITGYSAEETVGQYCWEIFRSSRCKNGCHMVKTINNQISTSANELQIISKSGIKIPVRANSAPLYDGGGSQIGSVETFQDISELKNLSSHLEEEFHFQNIIGRSKQMQHIFALIENVTHSDSNILITGESGTGKEIIARAIHLNSERKSEPFMAASCNAFAETLLESELFGHEKGAFTGAIKTKPGRFELAGSGTLFLDEIGDLTLQTQVKLLRVLETKLFERVGGTQTLELKARLVTATNKNLEEEIKAGRFREDLYYRINVININLPPLRERLEDLFPLINYFMEKFRKKLNKNIQSISPAALRVLKHYQWPGNIRELENVLEHAFVVCRSDVIDTEHLPERLWSIIGELDIKKSNEQNSFKIKDAEKALILNTFKEKQRKSPKDGGSFGNR